MPSSATRRVWATAIAIALATLLSACLLAPGRFASELMIHKDGRFAFNYTGEIHLLALSKLAELGDQQEPVFTAQPCNDESSGEERPCTASELAEQKRAWEEERRAAADKRKTDAASLRSVLGGIDPSSPQAAEEFAQRLRRQAGWRKVVHKGDGLFEVDFAISGRLDRDFAFPTIERFPMANAFVQVVVRNDGTVRVDAPGYGAASGGEPFRSMMQSTPLGGSTGGTAGLPAIDGRFVLRTDGAILANNTDEGPQPSSDGQVLTWTVTPRSTAAPTALIRLR